MSEQLHQYCDLALPVPIDQSFTYQLPFTLQHRVKRGCRLLVPFGSRQLVGVVLRIHNEVPSYELRDALRLLDEDPVLGDDLLHLGAWIAEYYCAPIGEVLRGMLPLGGEVRRTTNYSLTDLGHDVARQLFVNEVKDAPTAILHLLAEKGRSA